MVNAEDVISIYQSLVANGVQVWLTGGWGIDALLREQTRPHKDVDILLLVDDIVQMRDLLAGDGYGLKELWSENSWVVDARGTEIATAFVLHDAEGREIDAHAIRLDDRGNGVPAWADEGLIFDRQDLAGEGMIAGFAVRCLSVEMQVVCHTGYDLPDEQVRDLDLINEKFRVTGSGEMNASVATRSLPGRAAMRAGTRSCLRRKSLYCREDFEAMRCDALGATHLNG